MPELEPYRDDDGELPGRFRTWLERVRRAIRSVPKFSKGDGSPEGVLNGQQGDRYFNRTGGAGTWLYVKTTDGGNTGWVAHG